MTNLLSYLQGKKTTIATILGALITFSFTKGFIDADIANLLATIMIALGLSVNYASAKLIK